MKKITLAYIATQLKVSRTLVSMVLNGKGDENHINRKTQERVLAFARLHNYKPNGMARGLRTGRTNTIGLVIPDISNAFYSKIAFFVEGFASKSNYHVLYCCSYEDKEQEQRQIQLLREKQVDGLIVASMGGNEALFASLQEEGFPLVLIDRFPEEVEVDVVGVNNRDGAFRLIKHAMDEGANVIGVLSTGQNLREIQERIYGYRQALERKKISYTDELVREVDLNAPDWAQELENTVMELFEQGVDTLFAVNNVLALAVVMILKKHPQKGIGRNLLCFDDNMVFDLVGDPRVISMKQPIEKMSQRAVDLLVNRMEKGGQKVCRIVLDVDMVVR